MDNVRFGRALGFAARSAARTLIQTVDAARADPPASTRTPTSTGPGTPAKLAPAAPLTPRRTSKPAAASPSLRRGPLEGARRFRDSAVRPLMRLSGVLLLEVTGVFFTIFAIFGANTLWRARAGWHSGSPNHRQFLGGALLLAVFGYFSVSNFLRARRRERGR